MVAKRFRVAKSNLRSLMNIINDHLRNQIKNKKKSKVGGRESREGEGNCMCG